MANLEYRTEKPSQITDNFFQKVCIICDTVWMSQLLDIISSQFSLHISNSSNHYKMEDLFHSVYHEAM